MTNLINNTKVKIALTSDLHAGISINTYNIHQDFLEELAAEVWDVLILAGDLGTCTFAHFESLIKHVRKVIPTRPIVAVRGNHDLWDKEIVRWDRSFTLKTLFERSEDVFKTYNIHHLDKNFFFRDVAFIGWDGWYQMANPMTNDELWMPRQVEGSPTHIWLQRKAQKDFYKVIDRADDLRPKVRKIVAVTHMPIFKGPEISESHAGNTKWIEFLEDKCDVLCYGHTHHLLDMNIYGIRVINSGSDYEKPKYKIFDV